MSERSASSDFSAADQRRRRPPSVMIYTSDVNTCLGLCLSLHDYAQVSGRNGASSGRTLSYRQLSDRDLAVTAPPPRLPGTAIEVGGLAASAGMLQTDNKFVVAVPPG